MRVPLPIAILLALITISLTWWLNTRHYDFLSPPSEAEIDTIRREALASLVTPSSTQDAISIKIPIPDNTNTTNDPLTSLEPIDIGDITSPPALDSYSDRAPEGAETLLRLAAALENEKALERATLALERVLDLSQASPEHIQEAATSIRRIRPSLTPWNSDPQKSHPAIIQIGTSEKFAEILPEILEKITTELNTASSGLVLFSYKLNIGKSIQNKNAPTPIAVWINGQGEEPISTDVLSFTSDDQETLHHEILKTTFNLIRSHLSKNTSYNPAPETLDDPLPAIQSHITRLLWNEFGNNLNPKP